MTGAPDRAALIALVADPGSDEGGCREAARAAEDAGWSLLAVRAWQRVLGARPEDREALAALVRLHEERGEPDRAEACRRRLGGEGAPPPAAAAEPEEPAPGQPTDGDLVRFVHRFAGREDVHARMWREGDEVGWGPVHQPLTPDLVRAHLDGATTLGTYLVRLDGTVGFLVLDLDASKAALHRVLGDAAATADLRRRTALAGGRLVEALRGRGLDALYVDSGYKGRHLWLFFAAPLPAARAHALARGLAAVLAPADPDLRLEAFPKQDRVREGGLGNLVKLPLGLHLRSGRRAAVLDDRGEPLADPWPRLRAVAPVDPARLEAWLGEPAPAPAPAPAAAPPPPAPSVAGPRPWTEADFDASPGVGPVLRGCAVLREVVRRALAERRLGREASVVLNHSLGHLPEGPRAVNYLYDRVPNFAAEQRMGAPHRGSPVSCARVRQRLPDVADQVGCDCRLEVAPGGYAHPLLHLDHAPAPPPPRPALDELLAAYGRLVDRQRRVEEELAELRRVVVVRLGEVPDRRWRVAGGEWAVVDEAGLPVLRWEPG